MILRTGRPLRLLLAALLMVLSVPAIASSGPTPERVIVAFDEKVDEGALQRLEAVGALKIKELPIVDAVVVNVPSKAAKKAIKSMSGVKRVEPDITVRALAPKGGKNAPKDEVLPWGVDRVNADAVWTTNSGIGVKIAIVDTGIDTAHPDLRDNIKGGMSAVGYTTSYNDDNGHGTHVAGTASAVDNSVGVIGVAPASGLYAVKVLDRRGNGYLSDVIEGLQWAEANGMNVVNMSLGTTSYSSLFAAAVQQTIDSGVVVVAAAGNSGPGSNTVEYPAKFTGVIGVGATDSADQIASFSSRGAEVDLAAPGVSILSTYKKGGYSTLSGTSMATPHVTGTVALVLTSPIGVDDLDNDGQWDPAEVELRLERTAQDLGASGFDTSFGNGMVRADLAITP